MTLKYFSYKLLFKKPFSIAHGTRTHTDAIYVVIEHYGINGYGEVSFPPYLDESVSEAIRFLKEISLSGINNIDEAMEYINALPGKNNGARAALNMALCDIYAKQLYQPLNKIWNLNNQPLPPSLYTIGIGTPDEIIEIVVNSGFEMFKVKLGGPFDKHMINTLTAVTDKPFGVDANQGWNDVEYASDMIAWLGERGCVFVEQPLPKTWIEEQQILFGKSVLPLIADESIQTIADLDSVKNRFHGINVKLMKCGGLTKAKALMEAARQNKMKIILGCMSEGSCSCTAAAQLAPLADWVDLDGPLLIGNDLFTGITFTDGKLVLPDGPGTGAMPSDRFFELPGPFE